MWLWRQHTLFGGYYLCKVAPTCYSTVTMYVGYTSTKLTLYPGCPLPLLFHCHAMSCLDLCNVHCNRISFKGKSCLCWMSVLLSCGHLHNGHKLDLRSQGSMQSWWNLCIHFNARILDLLSFSKDRQIAQLSVFVSLMLFDCLVMVHYTQSVLICIFLKWKNWMGVSVRKTTYYCACMIMMVWDRTLRSRKNVFTLACTLHS